MTDCPLSRRSFLSGTAALFAWAYMPRPASAAGSRDPRFLTILLRGGLDGLSAVPPLADPDYERLRRSLAMPRSGEGAAPMLDGMFAINPRMSNVRRLFMRGEASILHACSTPYRERSHFDGQDVLETGLTRPGGREGWLARALRELPRGERLPSPRRGLGVGQTIPLILQGNTEVTTWSPQVFPQASGETVRRLAALYEARDPVLARALASGIETDRTAVANGLSGLGRNGSDPTRAFVDQAIAAARFMSLPDGPRIAAMSFDGWDTHAEQGPQSGRLARLLGALDAAIAALETGLGPVWRDTIVAIVTEFGRTARENGTDGTDHGTGTVAFLVGGAVRGGRVVTDWPGLAENRLFENRDLAPTLDLRAALKGVLADHLGMGATALSDRVFPDSRDVRALDALVRA